MNFGVSLVSVILVGGLVACGTNPSVIPPVVSDPEPEAWLEVPEAQQTTPSLPGTEESALDSPSANTPRRVVKLIAPGSRTPVRRKPVRKSPVKKPSTTNTDTTASVAAANAAASEAEKTISSEDVATPGVETIAETADAATDEAKDEAKDVAMVDVTEKVTEEVTEEVGSATTGEAADEVATTSVVVAALTDAGNDQKVIDSDVAVTSVLNGDAGKEKDADGDSVLDANDSCNGSVTNLPIDSDGCVTLQGFVDGIDFEPGTSDLTTGATVVLNAIAQTMKKQNELRLSVLAHINPAEDAALEGQLSKRRTLAVIRYLIGQSISGSRIRPAAANADTTNSRSGVEFRTLSN